MSTDFYKALFPVRGIFYQLLCAWRQFHNFSTVFIDRWLARTPGNVSFSYEGWEHIEKIAHDETGGILLMSHVGNWELGASYIVTRTDGPAIKLLLYLGEKQGEQIERVQKKDLALQGVKIISIEQDEPSPFELVEGLSFLKNGGFVSMTGDRLWSASQRSVTVKFLGREARIPAAPFQFALLSGSPLIVFLSSSQAMVDITVRCSRRFRLRQFRAVSAGKPSVKPRSIIQLYWRRWYGNIPLSGITLSGS